MKSVFAILVAILAAGSVYARDIKSGELVTITGKLGSYTEKEDGFTITITTDDVVVKGPRRYRMEGWSTRPSTIPSGAYRGALHDKLTGKKS